MKRENKQAMAGLWFVISLIFCCGEPTESATERQYYITIGLMFINLVASFLTLRHYSKNESSTDGNRIQKRAN